MRSKFENSLNHTDGFHDGYVKWNELSNQYESSDEDYLDVAEWMNGALVIYEKRQTEIDELTLQVAEMKSRLNDAYTDGQSAMYTARQSKIDELTKQRDSFIKAYEIEMDESVELQKRVDASLIAFEKLKDEINELHGQCDLHLIKYLEEKSQVLEQALKGGFDHE